MRIDEKYWDKIKSQFDIDNQNIKQGKCWIYPFKDRGKFNKTLIFLALWLKLNDLKSDDIGLTLSVEFHPIISWGENTNHQIIFQTENKYKSFIEFLDEFDNDLNSLFNPIPNGKLSITSVYYPLDGLDGVRIDPTTFETNRIFTEHHADIFCWLYKNCKNKYFRYGEMFFFLDDADAMYFKLSFAGA